jgi:hypothetical protein
MAKTSRLNRNHLKTLEATANEAAKKHGALLVATEKAMAEYRAAHEAARSYRTNLAEQDAARSAPMAVEEKAAHAAFGRSAPGLRSGACGVRGVLMRKVHQIVIVDGPPVVRSDGTQMIIWAHACGIEDGLCTPEATADASKVTCGRCLASAKRQ